MAMNYQDELFGPARVLELKTLGRKEIGEFLERYAKYRRLVESRRALEQQIPLLDLKACLDSNLLVVTAKVELPEESVAEVSNTSLERYLRKCCNRTNFRCQIWMKCSKYCGWGREADRATGYDKRWNRTVRTAARTVKRLVECFFCRGRHNAILLKTAGDARPCNGGASYVCYGGSESKLVVTSDHTARPSHGA